MTSRLIGVSDSRCAHLVEADDSDRAASCLRDNMSFPLHIEVQRDVCDYMFYKELPPQ